MRGGALLDMIINGRGTTHPQLNKLMLIIGTKYILTNFSNL